MLYIVVNAQVGGHHDWAQRASVPSLATILGAVSSVGIYRYNFETVELLRESATRWSEAARRHGDRLDTSVVETSLSLSDETVDRLIEVGGRLLRESQDFQEFLSKR